MSDALCGPSNALQNFQKHASVDRTLHQDRLTSRQSPSQGFRSRDATEGILDPEFAAFESNLSGPPLPDVHHAGPFSAPAPHHPITGPVENSNWAADFQNLQISGSSHPIHQQPNRSVAPMPAAPQQGWQNEFMAQQHNPQQSQQVPAQQSHQPYGYGFQPSFAPSYPLNGSMNAFQPQGPTETQQPAADAFDESAFEAAFEQARADMELEAANAIQENAEDVNETAQPEVAAEPALHEEIRIGSDTISQADKEETKAQSNDADELARTAGQLLNSVSHEKNQKFQQSNFLALMRRIRDREVHIEGDEFREVSTNWLLSRLMSIQTAQSLHPGGKYYPQDNKQQQMSRPGSRNGNPQLSPDIPRLNPYEPWNNEQNQPMAPDQEEMRKDDINTNMLGGRGDDNSLYEGWNLGDRWA